MALSLAELWLKQCMNSLVRIGWVPSPRLAALTQAVSAVGERSAMDAVAIEQHQSLAGHISAPSASIDTGAASGIVVRSAAEG